MLAFFGLKLNLQFLKVDNRLLKLKNKFGVFIIEF